MENRVKFPKYFWEQPQNYQSFKPWDADFQIQEFHRVYVYSNDGRLVDILKRWECILWNNQYWFRYNGDVETVAQTEHWWYRAEQTDELGVEWRITVDDEHIPAAHRQKD